jgi:hypothetical protein
MPTAPAVEVHQPANLGAVTPFAEYLAHGGEREDRGLILLEQDEQMVIPTALLEAPGRLKTTARTINATLLNGLTAWQKYIWWTTNSMHLGGCAPIDKVDDHAVFMILIGMARTYRP